MTQSSSSSSYYLTALSLHNHHLIITILQHYLVTSIRRIIIITITSLSHYTRRDIIITSHSTHLWHKAITIIIITSYITITLIEACLGHYLYLTALSGDTRLDVPSLSSALSHDTRRDVLWVITSYSTIWLHKARRAWVITSRFGGTD